MKKFNLFLLMLLTAMLGYSQDVLYYQDFEAATQPAAWHNYTLSSQGNGTHPWTYGSPVMPGGDDFATNAAIFDDDAAGGTNHDVRVLWRNGVNLSGYEQVTLSYDYSIQVYNVYGLLKVSIWDDAAGTWIVLKTYDVDTPPTADSVDISAAIAANSGVNVGAVVIGFIYDDENSASNWGAGVDNVRMSGYLLNSVYMNEGTATTCSDNFYDTGGPSGDFQNSEDYTLTVTPDTADNFLAVTFSAFDCDGSGFDDLKIYDGADATAPLLVDSNASGDAAMLNTFTATNTDGQLTFVFHSSAIVPNPGWEGVFSCVPMPVPANDLIANAITVTDIAYTDVGVNIPFAHNEGGNFVNCSYSGIPTVFYKFECTTASYVTSTIVTPAGISVPIFYEAANLNATADSDLTHVVHPDNTCGVGTTKSIYTEVGKYYYVAVSNAAASDISINHVNDAATGLADTVIDGFVMYPNPVENVLNLNAQNTIDAVNIYNLLGQKVLSATPSTTQAQIDMSALPTGAYIVKVQAGEQIGSYNLIKK